MANTQITKNQMKMSTARLLGRTTASTGEVEEITVGSGLSLSAGSLTATSAIDGSGTTNEITYWVDSDTVGALAVATYPSLTELSYVKGVTSAIQTQLSGKANTALSNLASVAINTTLVSDTDNTDDLGTSSASWRTAYIGTSIELGHASDTTLSRSAAGQIAVEGVQVATLSNAVALSNKTIAYSVEPSTDDTAYGETLAGLLAGDTIAQWDLVYLDSTSGRWEFADADAVATAGGVLLGLAMASGTDGNALTVLLKGIVRNDGWTWTGAGKKLYVSTTAGGMTETAPSGTDDVVRPIADALSDDCIFFNPGQSWATAV